MLQIRFDQIYLTLFYGNPLHKFLKTVNCFKFCLYITTNSVSIIRIRHTNAHRPSQRVPLSLLCLHGTLYSELFLYPRKKFHKSPCSRTQVVPFIHPFQSNGRTDMRKLLVVLPIVVQLHLKTDHNSP